MPNNSGAIPATPIHDGASSTGSATEPGPFSHADAAIMADAFRKVLRKQDFTSRVEGDTEPEISRPGSATETGHADAAIMADAFRKVLPRRKPDSLDG